VRKKNRHKRKRDEAEVPSDAGDACLFSGAKSEDILLQRVFWLTSEVVRLEKQTKRKAFLEYKSGSECMDHLIFF
jgi:hypothetical protein